MALMTVDDLKKAAKGHKGPLYREPEISDILDNLGADKNKYDLSQVVKGADHELEHGKGKWAILKGDMDIVGAVKIALTHLDEDPKYYDHLDEMEAKYQKKDVSVSEKLVEVLKQS